jgi:hypothetical protein
MMDKCIILLTERSTTPEGVVDGADSWYPYLKQKQKGKTVNTDTTSDTVLNEMEQLLLHLLALR